MALRYSADVFAKDRSGLAVFDHVTASRMEIMQFTSETSGIAPSNAKTTKSVIDQSNLSYSTVQRRLHAGTLQRTAFLGRIGWGKSRAESFPLT